MTDRFMNKNFRASGERSTVALGRNYAEGADTRQNDAIWVNATGTTHGGGYAGFTFDVDEAERFRDHLTALIEDVKSRKPPKPKNSEIIQGYGTGVVFELTGDTGYGKWITTETGALWLNGYRAGTSEELSFFNQPWWTPRITTL